MNDDSWTCPPGVLHLFEVVVTPKCVDTIQRLTIDPAGNDPDVARDASRYPMRDGSILPMAPRSGELLHVRCSKCGTLAVVGLGWDK